MNRAYLRRVPLPAGLTLDDLYRAMAATVAQTPLRLMDNRLLKDFVQANVMSGVVSNLFTAIIRESVEGMVQPADNTAWPDLQSATESLEIKATIHPFKGGEGHNGHGGWTIVASYVLDPDTGVMDFLTLSIAKLERSDWEYRPSSEKAATGTRRTETFTTLPSGTAKLRDGLAYLDPRAKISKALIRGRQQAGVPIPPHSPFYVASTIVID